MPDVLKQFNFINIICSRINRLPSNLVGLLTISGFIALSIVISITAMFAAFSLISIPYGIGLGILGLIYNIMCVKSGSDPNAYTTGQLIKLWSLAAVLGTVVIALFPMGRQLLSESQSFGFHGDLRSKGEMGIQIFAIGWMIIAVPTFLRMIALLPKFFRSIVTNISEIGMSAKNKCVELNDKV